MPHCYLVTADAEIVTVCTPSGMELFFQHAGWDLAEGPVPDNWQVTQEALKSAAERGGQQILGPPLAVDADMPERALNWNQESENEEVTPIPGAANLERMSG